MRTPLIPTRSSLIQRKRTTKNFTMLPRRLIMQNKTRTLNYAALKIAVKKEKDACREALRAVRKGLLRLWAPN